jgi:hypothetical protein
MQHDRPELKDYQPDGASRATACKPARPTMEFADRIDLRLRVTGVDRQIDGLDVSGG